MANQAAHLLSLKTQLLETAIQVGMLSQNSFNTTQQEYCYPVAFKPLGPYYKDLTSGPLDHYWSRMLKSEQDVAMFCLDLLLYVQWKYLRISQILLAPRPQSGPYRKWISSGRGRIRNFI